MTTTAHSGLSELLASHTNTAISTAITSTATHAAQTASAVKDAHGKATTSRCLPEPTTASKVDLPGTHLTLHHMMTLVGLLCMILTCVLCLVNFVSHLVFRGNFKEQRYLIRISFLPLVYVVFSWLSVAKYGAGLYLDQAAKLYEIYCVVCFFGLLVQVLTPDEATRKDFYIAAARMDRRNRKVINDRGSLRWFDVQRMFVNLALFVTLVLTILYELMEATTCHTSETNALLVLVIDIFSFVFIGAALGSLIRFYRRFRKEFQGSKVLRKFWACKGFVLVNIHMQILFEVLKMAKAVKPTKYMSEGDFQFGVAEFITICVAFLFSFGYIVFLSGLNYREGWHGPGSDYKAEYKPKHYPDGSVGKYLLAFFFPVDIFVGSWEAFKTVFALCGGRKRFDYTGGTSVGFKLRQMDGDSQGLTAHKDNHSDEEEEEYEHGYPGTEYQPGYHAPTGAPPQYLPPRANE